jgi:hypothetical protein
VEDRQRQGHKVRVSEATFLTCQIRASRDSGIDVSLDCYPKDRDRDREGETNKLKNLKCPVSSRVGRKVRWGEDLKQRVEDIAASTGARDKSRSDSGRESGRERDKVSDEQRQEREANIPQYVSNCIVKGLGRVH